MIKLEPIITFKNAAIREWLEHKGIKGKYIAYASPQDVAHRDVYGVLPYWLAAFAHTISEVSMPNLPAPERERFNRGDMTIKEMDEAGASIVTYQIRMVD